MPSLTKMLALAIAVVPAVPAFAQSETVSGPASVVNADILGFEGGQRVILWGVDAPEPGQTCTVNGSEWSCFDVAMRQLAELTAGGEVTCTLVGEPDPYRRRYGKCEAAGADINAEMVRSGLALAYLDQADDYAGAEGEAKAAQLGLWQAGSEFLEPWIHRTMENDSDVR